MKNYYKLGSYLFAMLMGVMLTFNTSAQTAASYVLTPSSGTFTPLVGGTATSLAATDDDVMSAAFPIGFNFTYGGIVYTTVQASSNGQLLFGTGRTQTTANNLATGTATERPGVAPLWDDIQCTSGVTYQVNGSAPNRTLTVEWLNMEWNYQTVTGVLSWQVVLHETSNVIDFIYRQEGTAVNTASGGASIGLMGIAAADFLSLQDVSASPLTSTSASTNNIGTKPATGQIYSFAPPPPPAAPPTPVQAAGVPSCVTGSNLTVAGPPPANETYYWQTTATGTSTASNASSPLTVFTNGTYYVRSFNSLSQLWGAASSLVVNNFTVVTPPPTPTAAQNPVCQPGTTITVPASGNADITYYWQGMNMNGTSNTTPASAPYSVTSTGTYYATAFDAVSQCWSVGSGIAVSVGTFIPSVPTATTTNFNICSDAASQLIEANVATGTLTATTSSTTVPVSIPDSNPTGITDVIAVSNVPAGATITNVSVNLTIPHTWDSDLSIYLIGANGTQIELSTGNGGSGDNYTNTTFSTTGATNITSGTAPFNGTYQPEGNLTSLYSVGNGNWSLKVIDGAGGDLGTLTSWSVSITYMIPPTTISWYNQASAGTLAGTGSPFETVGSSIMSTNPAAGTYTFYAEANSSGCVSTTRLPITVNVTEVLAVLTPVNASCNGGQDGSFELGTVLCGEEPFEYSINGLPYVTDIPDTLVAGTYSVVIQDDNGGISAPISVVITQPGVPTGLTSSNETFFTADLDWTTTGAETQWIIEYGPAGFTPGTGTLDTADAHPFTVEGLTPNTVYSFYVSAECGEVNNWSAVGSFATNTGTLTYDTICGPAFMDIATTGTPRVLFDDDEVLIALPFAFNYQGTMYNNYTLGNNGGIVFGNGLTQIGFTNGAIGAAPAPGLYPMWDDIGSTGTIYTQAVGTPGNEQYIIQYNKGQINVPGDLYSFQIVLDRATSEIYFIYADVSAGNPTYNNGATATIGATGPVNVQVSQDNAAYLSAHNCVHLYYELCPNVTAISGLIFADEADLNWTASPYGETDWTIVYGPAGFDPTVPGEAIDTLVSTVNSQNIYNLEQLTSYDVYIYTECQADNLTSDGAFYTFTTLPLCSNPSGIIANTDVDSLELVWNWTSTNPVDYPVTSFNIQYGFTGYTLNDDYVSEVVAMGTNNADTVFNAGFIAGGVYQVYVQAVCDEDTSSFIGPISFTMPLSNDDACMAEMLQTNGTVYTFNNGGGTVSTGEGILAPPSTGAQTTDGWINSTLNNTVWFKFIAPASGNVRVNATGINYNGQAAVYQVADCGNFATYDLQAANDNEIDGASVAPNFTICGLEEGEEYFLLFDGFNGTTGNYSLAITAINLEAGTAAPVFDVCTEGNVELFTTVNGEQTGGVWSSTIPSVNANINGSDFETEGLAYNTFMLQYRVTDGCAYDSIMTSVHVFPLANAGTNGTISACRNEPVDLLAGLSASANLGGTFYDVNDVILGNSQISASNIQGSYSYDYIVGNGVCPNDTSLVVVNVGSCNFLSLNEEVFNGVEVFPNPSEGIVFISSDISFSYEVTDANGRIITAAVNGVKAAQKTEINLSGVERGVYFIRLNNEDAQKTYRIVIR